MDYVVHQPAVAADRPTLPGQVVLVFQGGGALGAYQGGVYQAMHEAGIEPDWVIGTSIGAMNAAIIAGNDVNSRLGGLREFWRRIERKPQWSDLPLSYLAGNAGSHLTTLFGGIPGYFTPNSAIAWGLNATVGVEQAAFYTIDGLRKSLGELVDFKRRRQAAAADRRRRQRANRQDALFRQPQHADHARPRARLGRRATGFPAVRIDGDPYWDGGLYSNTPVEVVFDDNPRHDSVVFSVQIFPIAGPEPETVMQVLSRQKDIQFASRADAHIPRQEHIHQLRHMVRELIRRMPEDQRETPEIKEMAGYGCGTLMHIVQLNAAPLEHEDYLRDLDFTPDGIERRWQAGYADTTRTLRRKPWETPIDPMVGVAVYNSDGEDATSSLEKAS